MKKIAFHLNCLARGGAERVVSNLSAQFAEEGYDVTVATEWQEADEYGLHEKVRRVPVGIGEEEDNTPRFLKGFLRLYRLRRFVKEEKPDVLVAFAKKASYRALLATIGMKQKVVVCVRTNPVGHYDGRTDWFAIRLLFRRASGFVFQTNGQRDFFPAFVRKKSVVILNPVNPKYIGLPEVSERKKEVVHTGRIVYFKNHVLLIRAFSKVHEKHSDYVLKCYGGDAKDGTMEKIQKCIADLGAESYVKIMGDSDELEKLLPQASVYAFSSDWEGMPNAVLEAMAMGLPVVSTDCPCGGPATVIENGKNGLLVPIRDEEAMAAGISRLIEDREFAQQLGRNARKIGEIASGKAIFGQWKEYLESL